MVWQRNKHWLMEVVWAMNKLDEPELHLADREQLEDHLVYLCLKMEKHARYSHYYGAEKPKLKHFWDRAAAQYRIGRKVAEELGSARENPLWIKDRVEYWCAFAKQWVEANAEKLSLELRGKK